MLTAILCPFGTCLAVETAKKVPQHEDHENARTLFLGSKCPRWIGPLLEHRAKNNSIALSNQKRLLHALWRVRRRQRRCSVETSSENLARWGWFFFSPGGCHRFFFKKHCVSRRFGIESSCFNFNNCANRPTSWGDAGVRTQSIPHCLELSPVHDIGPLDLTFTFNGLPRSCCCKETPALPTSDSTVQVIFIELESSRQPPTMPLPPPSRFQKGKRSAQK